MSGIFKNVNLYLRAKRKKNDLYRGLMKIIVVNETNQQQQEEMLKKLKDVVNLESIDSITKQNNTSSLCSDVKAHLLKKFEVEDVDAAKVKVFGDLNYKYNPCRTAEEMWVDLQTKYLVYDYNNQKIRNKVNSMENIAKLEGYDGDSLVNLQEKLLTERKELQSLVEEFRDAKNDDCKGSWLDIKQNIEEKITDLEKTEGLLTQIDDVERANRFRNEMVLRSNLKKETEEQITEAAGKALKIKALVERTQAER